jgi:hypothetical protein
MKLIALVGFKGSGKDTAGRFLVDNYGFQSFSFAESLKDSLASIFCWDRALLEGATAESREWRETVDPWWSDKLGIDDFTPRLAMQLVGTNVFRRHFNNDLWILNIERKLSLLADDSKVVICDGRFPNELDLGRKYGGKIVRVKRGPEPEWIETARLANRRPNIHYGAVARMENEFRVHESEWAWIGSPIDETIENDSSIDRLHSEMIRVCL